MCLAWLWLPGTALAQTPTIGYRQVLEAVADAPAVRLAQSQLELARRQAAVAASPLTGTLTGGYARTWGRRDAPELTLPEDLDGGDFEPIRLSATINVVPFGPRFDQAQQAAAAAEQARRALAIARGQALVDGTEHYLDALRAQQRAGLSRTSLEVATTVLRARRTQQAVGAATDAAVMQAQIDLERARNEASGAERARVRALQVLSLTVGRVPESVAGEPPPSHDPIVPQGQRLEALVSVRTDVSNARQAVARAQRTAAAAIRDNLPSGTVGLRYQVAETDRSWSAGVGFDLRVWQPDAFVSVDPDSGLSAAAGAALPGARQTSLVLSASLSVPLDVTLAQALAAADASVAVARQQLEQVEALARLDLDAAADQLATALEAATLADRLALQGRRNATDVGERWRLGLVSELDVMAASGTAEQASLDAERAHDAVLLARMRLAMALGLDPLEVF